MNNFQFLVDICQQIAIACFYLYMQPKCGVLFNNNYWTCQNTVYSLKTQLVQIKFCLGTAKQFIMKGSMNTDWRSVEMKLKKSLKQVLCRIWLWILMHSWNTNKQSDIASVGSVQNDTPRLTVLPTAQRSCHKIIIPS